MIFFNFILPLLVSLCFQLFDNVLCVIYQVTRPVCGLSLYCAVTIIHEFSSWCSSSGSTIEGNSDLLLHGRHWWPLSATVPSVWSGLP